MDRFGVAQSQQRSNALTTFFNEVERDLDVAALLVLNLFRGQRRTRSKGLQDGAPQAGVMRKDLGRLTPQDRAARLADKALCRGADQHDVEVTGEEHDAVLK